MARVTFHHHLRGPWMVALATFGLVDPLLALLTLGLGGPGSGAGTRLGFHLTDVLALALPVTLLLLVAHGFRGAWLRDPGAAAARVGGYFAGTLGAVATGAIPWALATLLLTSFHAPLPAVTLALLVSVLALVLYAAAWISLGLLLSVALRREEMRWVGAAFAYALFQLVVPNLAYLVRVTSRDGAQAWSSLLDCLSPASLLPLFVGSVRGAAPDLQVTSSFVPGGPLSHPAFYLAVLVLWAALPLLLAIRLQSRSGDALPPLEQPL